MLGGTPPSHHSDEERLRGCPEAKLLTGTQAVRPCFIEILGMWASPLKILFIYLRERETDSKKGNPSRGVGEDEAGSWWRSPMRDSFSERGDHTLIRRQTLNDCATQVLRVVGFLIFQPAFWGRGLLASTQKTLFGYSLHVPCEGGW